MSMHVALVGWRHRRRQYSICFDYSPIGNRKDHHTVSASSPKCTFLSMHSLRRLKSRQVLHQAFLLLEETAMDSRLYRALTPDIHPPYQSSASAPSLRASTPTPRPSTPGGSMSDEGGNVKVVVRVRGFVKRGADAIILKRQVGPTVLMLV